MTAAASIAPASYALGGTTPQRVERPETPEAVAALLKEADDAGQAVVPWGAGTKQRFGNAPRRYDLALDVRSLNGVLEYEPADLVVTAQAGITLAALQSRLAESEQFLPLDPPYAERATLGGTLAANVSGPSRLLYGTARDMVLGLRVATPQGDLVKSGGRVVKNVVGYDLNKLHIGGLGTTGVMVEVTLKVQPLAAADATVSASFGDVGSALSTAGTLARSALFLRAVDVVFGPGTAGDSASGRNGNWRVLAWAAGSPATVERQVRDVSQTCADAGARGIERIDGEAHAALWRSVSELGPGAVGEAALIKLACLPSTMVALVGQVASEASLQQAAVRAGNGVAYVLLEAASAEQVKRIAALAEAHGGSAVVEDAPDAVKAAVDVWDPAGTAAQRRDDFSLMRAVKEQFDPKGTLNPGRFVAGI